MMEDDANFQLDPWELPPYFLLRKNKQCKSLRTYCGYWKEKDEELTAIRSAGESSSSSSATPSYVGVRKTLEFYLKDGTRGGEGTKTDWIIHEYHHLRKDDARAALFLEEDVVLRKVFKKGQTDQAPSLCRQVESCVKAYKQAYPQDQAPSCAEYPCVKSPSMETSEGLNEADGKSDNVCNHFTKIFTNDPNMVFAACHRCDEVLEAHPKIHGISPLQKHRNSVKCRSSCSNPSTDEDREMLHRLHTALVTYKQQKMDGKLECQEVNANLTQLNPWVLGHNAWYVTTSLNRQTNEGCWEEIDKFTAIRMKQQQMQGCWMEIGKEITAIQNNQLQMQVPQFMGLRRTLEFHLNQNGNKLKTCWIMLEYQKVDDIESPAPFLQGDMVIRKVFRYDKDAVSFACSELDRRLNADDGDAEYFNGVGVNTDTTTPNDCMDTPCFVFQLGEGMNTDTTTSSSDYMDTPVDRKRKRTGAASGHKSEVWVHFTKIYDTDYGLVYVVCHSCDRGYTSGRSKNGTSHLRRHHESCSSKRCRTGNANDATTEWETEIWPRFLPRLQELWRNRATGMCSS